MYVLSLDHGETNKGEGARSKKARCENTGWRQHDKAMGKAEGPKARGQTQQGNDGEVRAQSVGSGKEKVGGSTG